MDPMNQLPMMGGAPPPPPAVNAKEALNVPSLLIIIMGALGLVSGLGNIVMLLSGDKMVEPLLALLKDSLDGFPPNTAEQLRDALKPSLLNWLETALSLAASGFIIYGGLQMRAVRSWGLAMAAAVMSGLPLLSCCCCLGAPLAVWAVVILVKPEVRAQFT